jgi:hypothetical protein
MLYYVRLTTIAGLLGVRVQWLRGLIGQKVMDDERDNPAKGSPHLMHTEQIVQAIVAKRMRQRNIGYDAIRAAVDEFDVFGKQYHIAPVAHGIDLRLHRRVLTSEATEILKSANLVEYGSNGEEAAA